MIRAPSASRRAWHAALMTAAVTAIGMTVSIEIDTNIGASLWPSAMSATIGAVSLIYLVLVRHQPVVWKMAVVYLLNSFSVTFAFYLSNVAFATHGLDAVPFQGNKLAVFVAALLAPTMGTAIFTVALNTLVPVVQFFSLPEATRAEIALGEPWIMVAFGVAASIVMVSRFTRRRIEQRFYEAEADRLSLQRSAAKMQSIRDLMNTPLQTLEFATTILETQRTADPLLVKQIRESTASLAKLNETLTEYEIEGEPGRLSFDAIKDLAQRK